MRTRIGRQVILTLVWLAFLLPFAFATQGIQAQQKEIVESSGMSVVEVVSGMSALDSAVKIDGEGSTFIASVRNNGADAWAHVVKYAPAPSGTMLWQDDFRGGPGVKIDSVSLAASGSTLVVESTAHMTAAPRDYFVLMAYVPNIFTPNLSEPEDGPGAFVQPQATPIPGDTIDYARIQSIVHDEVQRAIDNMKPKARAAIDEAFDGGNGSYQVWHQLTDTSYTGALGALRTYFATPTPTATPVR